MVVLLVRDAVVLGENASAPIAKAMATIEIEHFIFLGVCLGGEFGVVVVVMTVGFEQVLISH